LIITTYKRFVLYLFRYRLKAMSSWHKMFSTCTLLVWCCCPCLPVRSLMKPSVWLLHTLMMSLSFNYLLHSPMARSVYFTSLH